MGLFKLATKVQSRHYATYRVNDQLSYIIVGKKGFYLGWALLSGIMKSTQYKDCSHVEYGFGTEWYMLSANHTLNVPVHYLSEIQNIIL